jgi:PLP dependent protein
MVDLEENIARVRSRIAEAAVRTGRRPDRVTLVAVTKTIGPERIREAVALGLRVFGENRLQEAREKVHQIPDVSWHLVGTLQLNKVKEALRLFEVVHSVDSYKLALEISRRAAAARPKPVDTLVQVNISQEPQKHGVDLQSARDLVADVIRLPGIRLRGLMGIAPLVRDPEAARPFFRRLRELRDRIQDDVPGAELRDLSMGMTDDFEVAIEEGSTMVRIGRALFASEGSRAHTDPDLAKPNPR